MVYFWCYHAAVQIKHQNYTLKHPCQTAVLCKECTPTNIGVVQIVFNLTSGNSAYRKVFQNVVKFPSPFPTFKQSYNLYNLQRICNYKIGVDLPKVLSVGKTTI